MKNASTSCPPVQVKCKTVQADTRPQLKMKQTQTMPPKGELRSAPKTKLADVALLTEPIVSAERGCQTLSPEVVNAPASIDSSANWKPDRHLMDEIFKARALKQWEEYPK